MTTPLDESAAAASAAGPRQLPIAFTGSGSEYFRIWIVNLMLTIVTLTLYLPFAKARRLAYFHGNTKIDGHALGFHGDPWKMLRGYLLMLALGGAYALANHWSPMAALVAIALMAAAWPALWRASLQFRLANTSWRGLRFRFTGDMAGAYKVMLPVFLPAVVLIAVTAFAGEPMPVADDNPEQPPAPEMSTAAASTLGLVMLAAFVLWPLLIAAIKRYQHGHYRYASQQTELQVGTGAFYKLAAKLAGVSLLIGLAGAIIGAAVGYGVGTANGPGLHAMQMTAMVGLAVGLGIFYIGLLLVAMPYWQSRVQNLVWGGTASAQVQFQSALKLRPLALLTLKNALLTALTLGLYWPFARIALTRLQLESMGVALEGDVEQWRAEAAARFEDASGDAAGDFFGIDLGL